MPIIINGPYYLQKGFIIIQLNGHIEIYNTNGDFVVGEIPFKEKIVCTDKNTIYSIIWPYEINEDSEDNPIIKIYELKK